MKTKKTVLALLLFAGAISSCKKDGSVVPELSKATIENIEIGLNNNEMGIIGNDFHFNADIIASDKIKNIVVKITPRPGEIYTRPWSYEILWDEYKGAKNATVHKHFSLPNDAVEGKYDFLIIVTEENGAKMEIKKNITIYLASNVPVNPTASIFNLFVNGNRFYRNGKFINDGFSIKNGDSINAQVTISDVKGDGKMYILLINKKLNHRPESIDKIDFNKVIVYDVIEHQGWTTSGFFSNSTFDPVSQIPLRNWPELTIGASLDNDSPKPNAITGNKIWEAGTYYFGVVYKTPHIIWAFINTSKFLSKSINSYSSI